MRETQSADAVNIASLLSEKSCVKDAKERRLRSQESAGVGGCSSCKLWGWGESRNKELGAGRRPCHTRRLASTSTISLFFAIQEPYKGGTGCGGSHPSSGAACWSVARSRVQPHHPLPNCGGGPAPPRLALRDPPDVLFIRTSSAKKPESESLGRTIKTTSVTNKHSCAPLRGRAGGQP